MKTTISVFSLLGALLLSSGCQTWQQADQDARAVALVTSQRVLTIKEELRTKIAAERKYYKAQLATIEKFNERSDDIALQREKLAMARSHADELVRYKGNITDEMLASQLLSSSTNELDELRLARKKRQELRAVSEKSISELGLLESLYESLNKTLIQLTTPPTTRDQMAQVASFIKSVAEHYKRLKDEAGTDSTK